MTTSQPDTPTPERLVRGAAPALDAILGEKFPVLDDGFVRVVDYMGDDAAVVQAARVSYGAGTKSARDDRSLVRYLMSHDHTTPFEMCELKLHVRVPMDTWRQWIRTRTASVNEVSGRYSVVTDSMQKTAPDAWRMQSATNKQGSAGPIEHFEAAERLSRREGELQAAAREVYNERLERGVAREQARKDLPLSTYTEAYWKIDLHNLLRFLGQRMDAHAQLEIRSYANVIGEQIVARWCPAAWAAFREYRADALTLGASEAEIVRLLLGGASAQAKGAALAASFLRTDANGNLVVTRSGLEMFAKLERLGVAHPWARVPA